jgi:hypothetical protein
MVRSRASFIETREWLEKQEAREELKRAREASSYNVHDVIGQLRAGRETRKQRIARERARQKNDVIILQRESWKRSMSPQCRRFPWMGFGQRYHAHLCDSKSQPDMRDMPSFDPSECELIDDGSSDEDEDPRIWIADYVGRRLRFWMRKDRLRMLPEKFRSANELQKAISLMPVGVVQNVLRWSSRAECL